MRRALIEAYYDGPEYLAKLRARVNNLKQMDEDPYIRAERIMNVYAVDPIAFIEDFLLIKLVEFGGQPKPFFMFDYQKEIVHKLQEYELSGDEIDFLIDKPRGMGLTWLVAAYFLWRFLFTPNYSAFILSRTEAEVDDGTANPDSTIFGKVRWMLQRLPSYMVPEGYSPKKARGTTTDMTLRLLNPAIGSSIVGSSTNSNAGRSRRYSTIFIDECFFIEHFQEVYRSLNSVARLKIFVSTVVESKVAKDFKDMCDERGTYKTLTYRDHPFKDEIWYQDLVKKAEALDDPDLMREAQVDYAINPKSAYYPMASEAKFEDVVYDRSRPLYMSLDIGGRQDLTVLLWWQFDGHSFKLLEAYENTNKPAEWYAPFMNPELSFNPDWYSEAQQKKIQQVKAWNKPVIYFGELDHTVKKMPTNTSCADVLWKFGIKIVYNQYAIQHPPRHAATSQLLPKMIFNRNSDAVMKVYDAIATSRYANMVRTTTENLKPIHGDDGTADRRAAVENFAVQVGRILRNQRDDVKGEQARSFAAAIIKQLRV